MCYKICLLFLILLVPLQGLGQQNFGSFSGTVKVEWLEEPGADRRMRLIDNFSYKDPSGYIWGVPTGAVINGASIPRALWTIAGDPYTGDYRNASVVHDYHTAVRIRSWQDVHRMFYWAMLAGGVGTVRAKLMYAAVYKFGPRWKAVQVTTTRRVGTKEEPVMTYDMDVTWREPFDEKSLKSLKTWIEEKDPSLEQIEAQPRDINVISNEPPSKLVVRSNP